MRQFLAILLMLALSGVPALAQQHTAEYWHVSDVQDPGTGKFSYCAVESGFDNGLYLAFARNRELNTNIIVSFPDRRLQAKSKYRMLVGIDTFPVRDVIGFSADGSTLVIPLQHDRKILDWLNKGKLLELKGPEDEVKFSLDGANAALRQLEMCVESSLKAEAQKSGGNPAARPQVAEGPLASNAVPGGDDMVEPLPLPAQPATSSSAQATAQPRAPQAMARTEDVESAPPEPTPVSKQAPEPPASVSALEAAISTTKQAGATLPVTAGTTTPSSGHSSQPPPASASELMAQAETSSPAPAAVSQPEAEQAAPTGTMPGHIPVIHTNVATDTTNTPISPGHIPVRYTDAVTEVAPPAVVIQPLSQPGSSPSTVVDVPNATQPDAADKKAAAAALAKLHAQLQARLEAETKAKADAEAKAAAQAKADAEAKAAAQAKADAEAKAAAQAKADAEAKAAAHAKADADAKAAAQAKADADAKAAAQAKADADAKAAAQAKADADAKASVQARADAEAKAALQAKADADARTAALAKIAADQRAQAQVSPQPQVAMILDTPLPVRPAVTLQQGAIIGPLSSQPVSAPATTVPLRGEAVLQSNAPYPQPKVPTQVAAPDRSVSQATVQPMISGASIPLDATLPQSGARTQVAAQPLGSILQQAGIAVAIAPGRPASNFSWTNGAIAGMATETRSAKPFIDAMLDDLDRREKHCKGQFSSSIGAPIEIGGITYSEVSTGCGTGQGTAGVILYYQQGGRFGSIAQETSSPSRSVAIQFRDKVEAELQSQSANPR